MNSLAQQAVVAALAGNWEHASKLNGQILAGNRSDLDALNRLARAYLELGRRKDALATYKEALKVDPYNSIAKKAVERLSGIRGRGRINHSGISPIPTAPSFLEEPGKTKTVLLIHLGATSVIASLDVGDRVKLAPHAHRVSVETEDSRYIGRLPDDISRRIIKFTRAGSQYDTYIKSVVPDIVRVFIREVKRGLKIADIPPFPQTEKSNYISFTPPDLIHDEKPDVSDGEPEI